MIINYTFEYKHAIYRMSICITIYLHLPIKVCDDFCDDYELNFLLYCSHFDYYEYYYTSLLYCDI